MGGYLKILFLKLMTNIVMIKPINIFIELVSVSGNPTFVYNNITVNPAKQPKINATKVFFILFSLFGSPANHNNAISRGFFIWGYIIYP